ncbi:MAG TPA: hypothetical protein VMN60_12210 [Longimicrobiales bacterium]|nr:hypothetical protein [Longimicrobiales bacterium]
MKRTILAQRIAVAAAVLLPLMPSALMAQQAPVPGERVRVRLVEQARAVEGAAHRQRLRGTLVRITADSLLLRVHPASDITAVARAGIDRLEVSRGVRTRLESATVNGARVALLGSIERVLFASIDSERYADETTWESALIGAAGGAVIGIAIGALRPLERWQRLRSW